MGQYDFRAHWALDDELSQGLAAAATLHDLEEY
jgi:hypothetical protein